MLGTFSSTNKQFEIMYLVGLVGRQFNFHLRDAVAIRSDWHIDALFTIVSIL